METHKLAEKAMDLSAFANSTTRFSNSIVLYTMFILQDILETLAKDPQANLTSILAVADSIAGLSLSLRI